MYDSEASNNPLQVYAFIPKDDENEGTKVIPGDSDSNTLPNMWSFNYIGLYCQYAAVGLLYG